MSTGEISSGGCEFVLFPLRGKRRAELRVGSLEGITFDETQARYPELAERLLANERDIDWPDGETAADLRMRVAGAFARLETRRGTDAIVVVSHGGVIGEMLASATADVAQADRWLEAGAAVSLERDGERWRFGDRISPGTA